MTRIAPPLLPTPAILFSVAGLLPAGLGAALAAVHHPWGAPLALLYAGSILSFLGGIWWGLGLHARDGAGWMAAAVMPSLVAVAIGVWALLARSAAWPCVAMAVAILLALPVDRALRNAALAPADWMRLRIPLSLGLGGLTILAGALAGR